MHNFCMEQAEDLHVLEIRVNALCMALIQSRARSMEYANNGWLGAKLRHIANEAAELPGLKLLGKPVYLRMFRRPYHGGNSYFGRYSSYPEAKAATPPSLPSTYAYAGTSDMYRDQHQRIRVSDYPLVYWLTTLLAQGQRRIFDLGGHNGVSYYGFKRYLQYPADMQWLVHDVPDVVEAGREWAKEHDPERRLAFTNSRLDADGHEVLLTSGALQYLDFTLPELLRELPDPPTHVLVNLVPMHPTQGYFTLQNIGRAILPYRVSAIPEFTSAMEALGYEVKDKWHSAERYLRVPFEPSCRIDGYEGFYFRKKGTSVRAAATSDPTIQTDAAG
ncbi:methyltransferase, TIGR04325 family [Pseudoxanthomonas gei]|uniref:Methyltransferase, TIGR04325 family n=2 Tax=Pseudoxanthomonas gei TaxID=1383030 RepID=A0ABX0AB28_9GAMM|nr:methyltransferase, TIGR04325 family [Pseudoxanthomonas gei]